MNQSSLAFRVRIGYVLSGPEECLNSLIKNNRKIILGKGEHLKTGNGVREHYNPQKEDRKFSVKSEKDKEGYGEYEKAMATYSSISAWEILMKEEPGAKQSRMRRADTTE